MDYETIDWEVEAKRIAAAFGALDSPAFILDDPNDGLFFGPKYRLRSSVIAGGYALNVEYGEDYCWYEIFLAVQPTQRTSLSLDWDGHAHPRRGLIHHPELMARALYHLDLLTPEVEAALGVSISALQKVQWMTEYEARNGL